MATAQVAIADLGFPVSTLRSGYNLMARTIEEQSRRLMHLFPGLGRTNVGITEEVIAKAHLPRFAEGWFAIPNWRERPDIFGVTYGEACAKALNALAQNYFFKGRPFTNGLSNVDSSEILFETSGKQRAMGLLRHFQRDPDILVIPGQLGDTRADISVDEARKGFLGEEFGLGTFEIAIILALHPERFTHYTNLWMLAAGDDYNNPLGYGSFSGLDRTPCFLMFLSSVVAETFRRDERHADYGIPTGFSPFGSIFSAQQKGGSLCERPFFFI